VAWRQGHLLQLPHVPGAHNVPAAVRVAPDGFDDLLDLVNVLAVRCRPAAPLVAIDRPQFTACVSPLVPDVVYGYGYGRNGKTAPLL
jgi:hypothetical protein